MDLIETMQEMHQLLRGRTTPEDAATSLRAPVERLAAYERFIFDHIHEVLSKNFVTFAEVVGEETWDLLVRGYFESYPADDYELNACARHFPMYVRCMIAAEQHDLTEAHAELADLDWMEFVAYASEAEIQERAQYVLNPTLTVLQLRYPIGTFVEAYRAWEEDEAGEPPALPTSPQAEVVFVLRDPKTLQHRFFVADDQLLFAFKMVHDELTVAEAARIASSSESVVIQALERAARFGLIQTRDLIQTA